MKKVLITGGLGKVGQWLIDGLSQEGYKIVGVDLEHPGFSVEHARSNVSFRRADLTELGLVEDIFQSVDPDVVAHFAAIPTMGRTADAEVFHNNITSTYNVLKSAGRRGADIVQASSESTYGMAFAKETWVPDYLPVDESHPMRPEDEYATSKLIAEEVAKMVTRRHDVDAVSLRPAWINYPGTYACTSLQDDLAKGANGFWSYLDIRDLVSLVHSVIETKISGHEAVLASAKDNYLGMPTTEAIEEHFGILPEEWDLDGDQSIYTTEKAHELFSWEPQHTWRTAADESVAGPEFIDF